MRSGFGKDKALAEWEGAVTREGIALDFTCTYMIYGSSSFPK